jgi:hypothetical protein
MPKIPPRRSVQGVAARAEQPRGRLRERVEVTGVGRTDDQTRSGAVAVDGGQDEVKVVSYGAFRMSTKDPS